MAEKEKGIFKIDSLNQISMILPFGVRLWNVEIVGDWVTRRETVTII